MKTCSFATLAAVVLTATSAFAAPARAQQGPGRPPIAHRSADYRGRDDYYAYDRSSRPDYREPARRTAYGHNREPARYDAGSYGPATGYGQRPAPQPVPRPRRPVAVAIQIQL